MGTKVDSKRVKSKSIKQPVKSAPKAKSTTGPKPKRQLAPPTYKKYLPKRFQKRQPKPVYKKLPKARIMFIEAIRLILSGKKAIGGIYAIYAIGLLLLVVGFSIGQDFSQARESLNEVFRGKSNLNNLFLQVFFLFTNTNVGSSPTAGFYQSMLLILCSLALIWALRELKQNRPTTTKESFYNGMAPLVPFILVVVIISIQLIPMTFGAYLYNLVTSFGIVVYGYEKFIALLVLLGLSFWSLRMVTSSMFAPYAVTLPGMQPLQATGSTKQLVRGRRLVIWRKVIFLPFALVILLGIAILPFVVIAPVLAPWIFFLLSCLAFVITHAYFYTLYRELIRE